MRIVVTGGAGFIGSHLCEKYLSNGNEVVCLDNLSSGDINNINHIKDKKFSFIKGDIRDPETVISAIKDADVICHLAAQIHVDRSYVEPQLTFDVNVRGTQVILEAARNSPTVYRIIYSSTSEVYGTAQYTPMDENHPLSPPHPYGASKLAADRMCYSYLETYGMDVIIMRCFNAFGPRQLDRGYGAVIPLFMRRVLDGKPPIVFGDGEQTRDYTYVKDSVQAYDAALEFGGKIKEPINFGSGQEITVNEIARQVLKALNSDLEPIHADPRPSEVRKLNADSSKAYKILGWKPKYSFEDGLKEYVKWYVS